MAKKIKILHILNLAGWGGAAQVVYNLAKNLDKNRYEIKIATGLHPDIKFFKDLEKEGIEIFTLQHLKRQPSLKSSLSDFLALKEIFCLIKKIKPDIIHLHNSKAGFLGRWAAWFYKIFYFKKLKIYFTVHGWSFQSEFKKLTPLFVFLEKLTAKITNRLIVVSEKVKNEGLKRKIAPASKFSVIYNGVAPILKEDKNSIKKELGLEPHSFVFGYVGRLQYPKRPDLFVLAASSFKNEPNCYFLIIGDGPLKTELVKLIQKTGLGKQVWLLGLKSPTETRRIMNAFDLNVLSTENEGFGLVILEAMSLAIPSIASAVGGILEIIKDGENGLLCQNEAKDFSQKMKLLKESPALYQKIAEEAKKTVTENFSLSKMIKEYEKLYEEDINALSFSTSD